MKSKFELVTFDSEDKYVDSYSFHSFKAALLFGLDYNEDNEVKSFQILQINSNNIWNYKRDRFGKFKEIQAPK